ncbi:hypothetical protein HUX53_01050, partial [Actinomadura sp. BRA 177]|nr:hypothetical protein [Actinomadura sp. BRA 177]
MIARPEGGPRVVVGVDDSAGARCALSWAIGAARLRRSPRRARSLSRIHL